MEIPVIVEPLAGNGYRATGAGGLSVGLTAEGATPAEAIDRLAVQVQVRLTSGAELAQLSVAGGTAPWKQDAGYLRDEPLYEPWREAMEENRRRLDEEDPDGVMSLCVLDTDTLTLYYHGEPTVVQRVDARPPTDLAISVMTVDEQLTGWYTLTRQARQPDEIARAYAHLGEAVVRLARWRILPYTEPAIARVAQLKALRLNVRLMDLRIAAIALENGAVVVTRNRRDFGRVPGLSIEDWSV